MSRFACRSTAAMGAILLMACASGGSSAGATGSGRPWQRVLELRDHVVLRAPVLGPGAAETVASAEQAEPSPEPLPLADRGDWVLQHTQANAVFQDIAFADDNNGFVAGELGIVYRTTDSGDHWQQVMNLGFPYYWYGVEALSAQDVVVSGFQNQTGEGVIRWSHDGGLTWGPVLSVHPSAWLNRIRFGDPEHGVATTIAGGQVVYTSNGGLTAPDWNQTTADPTGGWFAGNFTFLPSLRVFITGISFCRSTDGGAGWEALPSADPVFDGAAEFLDAQRGFTGGGMISPNVQGWVHRTTDGGDNWSARLTVTPYPVRTIRFASEARGWAAGGNIYSSVGGIHGSTDGGTTWSLELDTGAEMRGLALFRFHPDSVDVWCCGYTQGFQGRIYKRRIYAPGSPAEVVRLDSPVTGGVRSFPNPFSPATTLSLDIARPESVLVEIFDPAGRIIRRLRPGLLGTGTHQIRWDGRDEHGERLPSGIFFYRLLAGRTAFGGTLVLVR